MVIGLLAITAIPAVTGVAFGVSEQRKANTRMQDEKRMAKFYMQVYCEGDSEKAQSLNGRRAVLRDNKVSEYIHQGFFFGIILVLIMVVRYISIMQIQLFAKYRHIQPAHSLSHTQMTTISLETAL